MATRDRHERDSSPTYGIHGILGYPFPPTSRSTPTGHYYAAQESSVEAYTHITGNTPQQIPAQDYSWCPTSGETDGISHHDSGQYQVGTEAAFEAGLVPAGQGTLTGWPYGNGSQHMAASGPRLPPGGYTQAAYHQFNQIQDPRDLTMPPEETNDTYRSTMNEASEAMPTDSRSLAVTDNEANTTGPPPLTNTREDCVQCVRCLNCGKVLKGPHATGNLTRHQKTKECAFSPNRREYPCGLDGCTRVYQRSDGLLNHRRRRHNAPGPFKRNSSDDDH